MTGMPVLLALMLTMVVLDDAPGADDAVNLAEIERLLLTQPGAVEQVWTQLSRGGLPRIEPIAGDAGRSRVTFFYKAGSDVTGVRLNSVINAVQVDWPVEDFVRDYTLPMQRLGGSPIWRLSLDIPRDVQASYSFLVTRPGGTDRVTDPHNPRHLRGRAAEAVLSLDRVGDVSPGTRAAELVAGCRNAAGRERCAVPAGEPGHSSGCGRHSRVTRADPL